MPYNDKQRHLALQRALKFSKLFQENNFDTIMAALVPNPNQNAFVNACNAINLDPADIAWLWNYLQHCDKNKWWPALEAAAGTGW